MKYALPRFEVEVKDLSHRKVVRDVEIDTLRLVNVTLTDAAGPDRPVLIDEVRVL